MMILLCAALLSAEPTAEELAYKLIKDNNKVGVACTSHEKGSFGSVMPYSLDSKGQPVVLISDLAVHTKNIKRDPKSSIFVMKDREDFNSARATLVGKFVKVPEKELETTGKHYFKDFPQAKIYSQFHDFNFYRLEVTDIYYVGGFGPKPIEWLDMDKYKEAASE